MALNVLIYDRRVLINIARLGSTKSDLIFGNSQKNYFNTSSSSTKYAQANDIKSLDINYKRGTGGRSSYSGKVVTVFGCSGKLGRIILNRLGKEGYYVVAPFRGDDYFARPLKLCGDLGQINLFPFDLKDDKTIRQAVEKSNIVINCIGRDWETNNFKFEDINIDGPRRIAKISRETGVEKLIHISALNASPNPQKIFKANGSKFLRTKYEGELAVRSEYPEAVIIRPSVMYGEEDRFLLYYTQTLRRTPFAIYLWKKGEKTVKMPVHYSDVASGVMKIIENNGISGRTFDFTGPDRYLLSEIVDYIYQILRRPNVKRTNFGLYYFLLNLLYENYPKRKFYNFDFVEREFISDIVTPEHGSLRDLGVEFRNFAEMANWHLKVYNRLSYYDEKLGEFPDPEPPKPLSDEFELNLK